MARYTEEAKVRMPYPINTPGRVNDPDEESLPDCMGGQVSDQIQRQEDQIIRLRQSYIRLQERLSVVLRPVAPDPTKNIGEPQMVVMAERIYANTAQIIHLCEAIENILDRLEL